MKNFKIILLFVLSLYIVTNAQSISIPDVNAATGDSVTIPINVQNFANVGAITLKIQFDESVLNWGRAVNWNSQLPGALANVASGVVTIAWDGLTGVNISDGKLVELKFLFNGGTSNIDFIKAQCEIADENASVLNVTYTNGSVSEATLMNIDFKTDPSGRTYNVDGINYTSEKTFSWIPGSVHSIGTTSPQGDSQVRYVWKNWSDSKGINHNITIPTVATTYTVYFTTQYYLSMNVNPSDGGTITPQSGWHNSGAQVQLNAVPNNGYNFVDWSGTGSGSYSGANNPVTITGEGPIKEYANFNKVDTSGTLNLLYLKVGAPSTWTVANASGSQYQEISVWKDSGYVVTTMDLSTTQITESLLSNYKVLRINGSSGAPANLTATEGTAIYNWVMNGGKLFADIPFSNQVSAVSQFGVSSIEGQNGGTTGLDWYFYGAPLRVGPLTGPNGTVDTLACESMDHPILNSGNTLTIDAQISSYPAVVHGSFGSGRVVIVFVNAWSHDSTYPGNAYRAELREGGNLQFLANCINFITEKSNSNTNLPFVDEFNENKISSSWQNISGTWNVSNGVLKGYWDPSNAYADQAVLLLNDTMYKNLSGWSATISYQVSSNSKNNGQRVTLYNSPNNLYHITITPSSYLGGEVGVEVKYDGLIYSVIFHKDSISVYDNNVDATNTFTVQKNNTDITMFVNNTRIGSFIDTIFNGNFKLGLGAYGDATYDTFTLQKYIPNTSHEVIATGIKNETQIRSIIQNAGFTIMDVDNIQINDTTLNGKKVLALFNDSQGADNFTQNQANSIVSFVDNGGDLYISSRNSFDNILNPLGANATGNDGGTDGFDWTLIQLSATQFTQNPITNRLTSVVGDVGATFTVDNNWQVLGKSSDSTALLAERNYGKGKVILWYAQRSFRDPGATNNTYETDITQGSNYQFYTNVFNYFDTSLVTGVNSKEHIDGNVSEFLLSQNYPNPFNPSTTIKFALPEVSNVKLVVYNILGREITTLINRDVSSGIHQVQWNASSVPSGVYFVRIVAQSTQSNRAFTKVQKMMLLK